MSGHSKWNNIKRKKEKTDGQRAKVFTKIARELAVAVKEGGGPDPAANSKLKDAIAKAKANNVPNDNIERAIKKASSEGGENWEALQYEGYGPSGIAVIVAVISCVVFKEKMTLQRLFTILLGLAAIVALNL